MITPVKPASTARIQNSQSSQPSTIVSSNPPRCSNISRRISAAPLRVLAWSKAGKPQSLGVQSHASSPKARSQCDANAA